MTFRKIEASASAYSYPLLIKHLLHTPMIYSPDQEIVYRDVERYTYRDFGKRVNRLANMLESQGIKPGDTVAILDWDSHRYLECFFGVPMMGAVLHTVNFRLSPEHLIYTINHARDDILLVNEEFMPLIAAVRDKLTTVKKIVLLTDRDKEEEMPVFSIEIDGEYESLLYKSHDEYDFPDFDENTMATTFYTTGTTGLPKGVYFSHRQIVLHTYGIMAVLGGFKSQANVNSSDVYMPLTPMFHVHAWGLPYLMTFLGAKQVYPGRYEPPVILKLVTHEGVTFSHCVPTIIHLIVSSQVVKNVNLSGWKVIMGGSALPKGLCKAALEIGINIYSGYGMSETCPVLGLSNLKPHMLEWDEDDQANIRCKAGLPAPGIYMEIWDSEGKPVPRDGKTTGEVVVRGPWLTQGYMNDPEKGDKLWEGGWLHTGDVGFIDDEGYLQITDRMKDVIKTGGEWISSILLEDILSQHHAASEAAVIGVPDEKWGERPHALVVLKEPYKGKVTEDDLKVHVLKFVDNGDIPKYGVPGRITFVDEIEKTSVGKINKLELRKKFA